MAKARSRDPLRLDPEYLAFHQLATFAPAPLTLTEALERSPLFHVEYFDRAARVEWVRHNPEGDPEPFPLGVVTLHSHGILLETFGDERMTGLKSRVDGLQSLRLSADEIRIVPVAEMIARPRALLSPLADEDDRELDRREVAIRYLRMAWPFLSRPDLGGRAPYLLVRTGRGRRELDTILEGLPDELASTVPGFPRFEPDELRKILLPEPAPLHPEIPGATGSVTPPPNVRP
jgi:hypothetical protein